MLNILALALWDFHKGKNNDPLAWGGGPMTAGI
jgi:hypothetical protein